MATVRGSNITIFLVAEKLFHYFTKASYHNAHISVDISIHQHPGGFNGKKLIFRVTNGQSAECHYYTRFQSGVVSSLVPYEEFNSAIQLRSSAQADTAEPEVTLYARR